MKRRVTDEKSVPATLIATNSSTLHCVVVTALVLFCAACAQTRGFKGDRVTNQLATVKRVLLMPSDVELSLLTASGLLEPNAAWTKTGRSNVDAAMKSVLAEKGVTLVPYHHDDAIDAEEVAEQHVQLVKLHGAIGNSILLHKYVAGMELPTMEKRFNWTLGRGSQRLRDAFGVDHAVFIYARDSFASGGRTALIFAAALFGVGVQGGSQTAFISVVNLETGDIAWFNVLASPTGDLRQAEQAKGMVRSLLSGAPL